MMAMVSPPCTSEVGKELMLFFELRGCLVQGPGETPLVPTFAALAFLIYNRSTILREYQGAPQPSQLWASPSWS